MRIGCVVAGVEIVWLEDDEDGSCEGIEFAGDFFS